MILAKVLGNVVATQKNHRYENARVMLCEQITPEGDPGTLFWRWIQLMPVWATRS
jgi:microcompartment protein CcmK/EutM